MTTKEINDKITQLKVHLYYALRANDFEDFEEIGRQIDELEKLVH